MRRLWLSCGVFSRVGFAFGDIARDLAVTYLDGTVCLRLLISK